MDTTVRPFGPCLTMLLGPAAEQADQRSTQSLPEPVSACLARLPSLARRLSIDADTNVDVLEMAVEEAQALSSETLANIRLVAEPVSTADLKMLLEDFVASWPDHGEHDRSAYVFHLSGDVGPENPSYYALVRAARNLRRSCRTVPSICEVLDEIAACEGIVATALQALHALPSKLRSAQETLAYRRGAAQAQRAPQRPAEPPRGRSGTTKR